MAKGRNSKYEPGQRSGAWMKMRVNKGQELVIGGYTPSPKDFDALVIGLWIPKTPSGLKMQVLAPFVRSSWFPR